MGKQDDQGDDQIRSGQWQERQKNNDWFNMQNIKSAGASLFLARFVAVTTRLRREISWFHFL